MPHVELRDCMGMTYRISTASPAMLQAWLEEWLPRLYPPDLPAAAGDPVVHLWPLDPAFTGNMLDWVADGRVNSWDTIPRDPAKVPAALAQIRARLEAQVKELDSRGR